MAKGIPKIALARPTTGLAASERVSAPSGTSKPKLPMMDTRQNVGQSNLTKVKWGPGSKLGNHE